ncbi:leucyl aminopeptidase family protein [Algoriphagus formosus]|uniref:Leucyl aminopeptidase family protein n=1 Tax=Algoriphagus formosus TaxID=2007308 RepID=A0A4R5UTV4_9BACT|nr:leucyl aminopeptidase family protein [Algoriphagus aquimaris]TDK42579.1 leucyl aminopeptidase family protein [Algoriphagus aquimaris]
MQFQLNPKSKSQTSLKIFPLKSDQVSDFLRQNFPQQSISELLFSGKENTHYAFSNDSQIILLLGLGDSPSYKSVENAFRRVLAKQGDWVKENIELNFSQIDQVDLMEASIIGLGLGAYHLDFFKKERKEQFQKLKVAIRSNSPEAKKTLFRAEKILDAKLEALLMVDLPPNVLTPKYLADWAKKTSKKLSLKAKIFDRKKAKSESLEAFLAVARGSAKEPQFIILEYRQPKAKKHIGLVGKGVTFDTGGLNVKTQGMHYMKSDMGGAAAVLAATQLIASLQVPINLTCIVPTVENAIDKDAYLPSEVIESYSGKSIEIVDTDAEGRLILADGLAYLVKNYQTDHILDFATLTGSAVGTFGYECAALFSNDESLSKQIQDSGIGIGEKSWPLPIWKEYAKEMDSEIADIRNYHGKPLAGAITAATFLQAFTNEHPSWAHLDIAGVAFGDSEFAKTKSGTSYGVNLLLNLIENLL